MSTGTSVLAANAKSQPTTRGGGKEKKTPRRFAQAVHPSISTAAAASSTKKPVQFRRGRRGSTTTAQQQPSPATPNRTLFGGSKSSLNGWGSEQRPRKQSVVRRRKPTPLPTSSNASIESLEARLAKRFGTDLTPWTSSDAYYDDDDDDEDDGEEAFRGNPVVDPWAQEEAELRSGTTPKGSSPLAAFGSVPSDTSRRSTFKEASDADDKDEWIKADMQLEIETEDGPAADVSPLTAFGLPPKRQESVTAAAVEVVAATASAPVPILHNGVPLELTLPFAQHLYEEALEQDETHASDNDGLDDEEAPSWPSLGIADPQLLANLDAMDCATPLPVQRNACPAILDRSKDVVVGTYTGSGKTLAFLVPAIQHLLDTPSEGSPRLMVIAPGRELASQIVSVAREVVAHTGLTVQFAIGGTTYARNVAQIRKGKPDIVIGTPGRLAELVVGDSDRKRGRLATHHIETIVLDECDALLEYKAHRDPTHAVLTTIRRQRRDALQAVLCSATATDLLEHKKSPLAERGYLRPGFVTTLADAKDALVTGGSGTRVSRTVLHGVVHVPHRRRSLDMIRRILHTTPVPQQILIFVADARRVTIVVEKLGDMGILAAPLHGTGDKEERAEVNRALREGTVGIVVATELAARGLDAPLLTHVINMDLPTDASHAAHRAGRCGRGGRPGVVVHLTTSPQERKVPHKLASLLGVEMHTVNVRDGKMHIVDPESIILDA